VLTGLAVDIGGTIALNLALWMVYAWRLMSSGMSAEQAEQWMTTQPPAAWLLIAGGLLGSALSVTGGFACARIARRHEYRLGGLLAILSPWCALLLAGDDGGAQTPQAWLLASSAACVMLGAHWGCLKNRGTVEDKR
jgi:hypothetical protein